MPGTGGAVKRDSVRNPQCAVSINFPIGLLTVDAQAGIVNGDGTIR